MTLGESVTLQFHHHPDQDQCYHTINVTWEYYQFFFLDFFIPLYKLLNLQLPIFSTSWHNMLSLRISAPFFFFLAVTAYPWDFSRWYRILKPKSALLFQFYMCASNNPAGSLSFCSAQNNYSTITTQSLQNSLHISHCYYIQHYKITIRSFCKNVSVIWCNLVF